MSEAARESQGFKLGLSWLLLIAGIAAVFVWRDRPPLSVSGKDDGYVVDVMQWDMYPSTVNRLQIRDGGKVVWEIRAKGDGAQFHTLTLRMKDNPTHFDDVYHGEYTTVTPTGKTFDLKPGRTYVVRAWGEGNWPSSARFVTKAEVEPIEPRGKSAKREG